MRQESQAYCLGHPENIFSIPTSARIGRYTIKMMIYPNDAVFIILLAEDIYFGIHLFIA